MKKIISIVIGLVVALSLIVSASAAGYALPEKMMKQIQVGSGIKGTINLKGNADADLQPFFAAVQNANMSYAVFIFQTMNTIIFIRQGKMNSGTI